MVQSLNGLNVMSIDCYFIKIEHRLPLAWAVRHESRWASQHLAGFSTQESTPASHLGSTVELALVLWPCKSLPKGMGREEGSPRHFLGDGE